MTPFNIAEGDETRNILKDAMDASDVQWEEEEDDYNELERELKEEMFECKESFLSRRKKDRSKRRHSSTYRLEDIAYSHHDGTNLQY